MFLLKSLPFDQNYTCGGNDAFVFAGIFPSLVSTLIDIIKIAVPIILIIYGMMDLGKAVMAQKDDEIKKGQQTFVKRLTAAVVVFLVFFIVQLVVGLVSGSKASDEDGPWGCVQCFINGECDQVS